MIETWIPVTIAAAFFQNVRSAIQKHLTGTLSGQGAAYSRFLFAMPWALIYLAALFHFTGWSVPQFNAKFALYCLLGAVVQIVSTVLLLKTFSYRSFAVGTTYSKLEIVFVAIFGSLLLGDFLTIWAKLGVSLSTIGLIALSAGQNRLTPVALLKGITHPSTLLGLGAALFLGLSVIFFRGASLALTSEHPVLSAAFTLAVALVLQTLIMGVFLLLAEPGQIQRVLKSWRWSSLVGIAGMLASVGWFTAFTLQNGSYVRALGQIELLFTFVASTRVFRERVHPLEWIGCGLILAGIFLLLLT